MKLFKISLLTGIALFSASVMAAPPNNPDVKNGFPCFKEICIGDELQDLSHIKWEGQKIKETTDWMNLEARYKETTDATIIAPEKVKKSLTKYIGRNLHLDSKMVKLLGQVDAFCRNPMQGIVGVYRDPAKGFTTTVKFVALSNRVGVKQRLVAVSIARVFDYPRYQSSQIASLYDDLLVRYSSIDNIKRYLFLSGSSIHLMVDTNPNDYSVLMQYPGCTSKLEM